MVRFQSSLAKNGGSVNVRHIYPLASPSHLPQLLQGQRGVGLNLSQTEHNTDAPRLPALNDGKGLVRDVGLEGPAGAAAVMPDGRDGLVRRTGRRVIRATVPVAGRLIHEAIFVDVDGGALIGPDFIVDGPKNSTLSSE